jgi:hypothetical protein
MYSETELECLREKYRWMSDLLSEAERLKIVAFLEGLPTSKQEQLKNCTPKIHWLSHLAGVVLQRKFHNKK